VTRESLSQTDYRSLAEFRYRVRQFLHFSEGAARDAGINPAQHQLLLALRGIPAGTAPSVGNLAKRLMLRHHSAVELIDRLEHRGFVRRAPSGFDRRQVLIEITAAGERVLERLSLIHRAELRSAGASLMRALRLLIVPSGVRRGRQSP